MHDACYNRENQVGAAPPPCLHKGYPDNASMSETSLKFIFLFFLFFYSKCLLSLGILEHINTLGFADLYPILKHN